MIGKMQLYYAAGAREVWLCDEAGRMEFFVIGAVESVPVSVMCPAFPRQLDQD
jgi:hypothetical protein